MINITSEGNLFTSFCTSVAGTASFHQLAVTALFQFFIPSYFLFLLVNFNPFSNKKKKKCCRIVSVLFLCGPISTAGLFSSGLN